MFYLSVLGTYLGVRLLGPRAGVYLAFIDDVEAILQWLCPGTFPAAPDETSTARFPLQSSMSSVVLTLATLLSM